MKVLLQRVSRAAVRVDGETVGEIGQGVLLLVGVEVGDAAATIDNYADKAAELRIFADDAGKMNLNLEQVGGAALVVSQFTLAGKTRNGRRPSYTDAARPEEAEPLYERFAQRLRDRGIPVATGRFGAMMEVELVNDGPVTLWLEAKEA